MEVKIQTEFIKLDSFLKFCGAASLGSEAKMYVLDELGAYPDIKERFLNKINSHGMDAFDDKKSSMILKYRELKRQGVLYSDEDSATKILEA